MIIKLWIRMNGGFWAYRKRLLRTRTGQLRRFRIFIYSQYLESLGSYIAVLANFDGEPIFPHKPQGIFIAPDANIGSGVTLYQHVTIGVNEIAGSAGFGTPTIGNDVFIGAGARVIGNVFVGDGARIGAGAIVVTDVPAGALAVSPKAVVRHAGSNDATA